MQITGGSSSTPDRWTVLRQAGANLNMIMTTAAANRWNVPKAEVYTDRGTALSSQEPKKAFYSELIADAQNVQLPKDAPLKATSDFKFIGKMTPSIDAEVKSTGKAQFGIDNNMPNLKVAVVERCPTFGGSVKSFDASEAKKIPGFHSAFEISSASPSSVKSIGRP